MNLNLTGETAIIVGGARGIGYAIAEAFAAEGCAVGLVDRDNEALNKAQLTLDAQCQAQCEVYQADVSNYADVQASASHFQAGLGRIDHVVCAAAIGSGKFGFPFWNLEPGDWPKVIEVTLIGSVNTAHAYAPHLIEQGKGTLLFLTSVAGQIGSQTDPPYSAAKAAVTNFMQCAAKDLASHHVRVNALSPGMVQTSLNQSVWASGQADLPEAEQQSYDDWGLEKIRNIAPLGRWQEPKEFGAMATFLASEHATNITGQTLNIDGGQVMHS